MKSVKLLNIKKRFLLVAFLLLTVNFAFSQNEVEQNVANAAFVQGAAAYQEGNWMSSVFMLRRAISYSDNYNADTLYMLISAQMYANEYKSAYQDCETFLNDFSESVYVSYVMYHKGRALFCLGEYERCILILSDFCHFYPENEMYASALFWIAESFYTAYNYEDANILYNRIVSEFPEDAKASAAQYRIETIAQKGREEKLLYLLKETGEEYLASKEEYERLLKLNNSENSTDVRSRIMELTQKNTQLTNQVNKLETEKNQLQKDLDAERLVNSSIKNEQSKLIEELKQKALRTQELMKSKN